MKLSWLGAFASGALMCGSALAQDNGAVERPPVTDHAATAQVAIAVTPGGPWYEFSFGAAGVFAKGCAPADPAGAGCVPSSAGNSTSSAA